MERQQISRIAHSAHPVAAPLSDGSVRRLLDQAVGDGTGRVLDLGCGEAPWLLRALAAHPRLRAVGVDTDAEALTLAQRAAETLGVAQRLGLHHQDAREFGLPEPFDVVLCVGATHAFGGLAPTLAAVARHLAPGGVALVGEGYWEREPDPAALAGLGGADPAEFADLPTTVARVVAEGWTPVQGHISSLREWDDYEWSWTGSLARWALDHPDHPDSAQAAAVAAEHRAGWLGGYRGTLGFVTLLLRRSA
ncbi:class I SAM-dependent methyltransferase [Kitasatospora kazusensis]|uniref:Class I SAM-dependent methyltransferase n=1 Tax=Kitasatospora kazusensis TaxID=407974 RepID=A0ABN3A1I5_9ACTN